MNNIALGRYIPLDSIIHKLDPRAKIVCLILWMIAIFIPAGWWGYGVIGAAVLTLTLLAKLKLRFLWRSMRPMLFMLVFLLIINVLVLHEGSILFQIGSFAVYSEFTNTVYCHPVDADDHVDNSADGDHEAIGVNFGT